MGEYKRMEFREPPPYVTNMDKDFSKYCKPNTKEYWQNVWFYYRVHIIVGIIIVLLAGYTVKEVTSRKDPDFSFMYVGETMLGDEESTQSFFEKYVTDVDGDGTVYPNVLNLALGDGKDAQYTSAILQKADLMLAADDDPFIMLIEENNLNRYVEMEAFAEIDKVVKRHAIDETGIIFNDKNKAICIDVTGTEFAEKVGYIGDKKIYLGLKFKKENKKNDEEYLKLYAEAERMLDFILDGKF